MYDHWDRGLIIDRLNACKHWKSEIDCEMAELLVNRYVG